MGIQATIASASRIEKQVCAVVISYLPNRDILDSARALTDQLKQVVVVDNTPTSECSSVLDDLERLTGCTIIRNGKNLGIAAALNIGIRHAISLGYDWIATFDQDSKVCDGYFEAIFSAYQQSDNRKIIGMLYPRCKDIRLGTWLAVHRDEKGRDIMCMTSGAMMRAETFLLMGPMEEELFIDYVDYEYCMRMRFSGLRIVQCPDAVLLHSLGHMTMRKLLWRKMSITNHNARRYYYINRNRLVLIRRYMVKYPWWSFHELKGIILDAIKAFLLESDRFAKMGYLFRGMFDGLLGRLGPRVAL